MPSIVEQRLREKQNLKRDISEKVNREQIKMTQDEKKAIQQLIGDISRILT